MSPTRLSKHVRVCELEWLAAKTDAGRRQAAVMARLQRLREVEAGLDRIRGLAADQLRQPSDWQGMYEGARWLELERGRVGAELNGLEADWRLAAAALVAARHRLGAVRHAAAEARRGQRNRIAANELAEHADREGGSEHDPSHPGAGRQTGG